MSLTLIIFKQIKDPLELRKKSNYPSTNSIGALLHRVHLLILKISTLSKFQHSNFSYKKN